MAKQSSQPQSSPPRKPADDAGILIVFDGIDGGGKTTQAKLLADILTAAGETVVLSKEPTDGPWGKQLRASATTGRMSLADELHAFTEDRKQHVTNLIAPALARGEIVILDRYFYSTIAYQGARGTVPHANARPGGRSGRRPSPDRVKSSTALDVVELYPYVPYVQYLLPGSITMSIFMIVMIGGGTIFIDGKAAGCTKATS